MRDDAMMAGVGLLYVGAVLFLNGAMLFGFTYLYVAFNLLAGLDGTGLGYFSAFVAVAAVVYSLLNFVRFADATFGVIWLYWAFLWALFFLLLGRGRTGLARYTGAVAVVQGWVTAAIPAFLLLTGNWGRADETTAVALAGLGVIVFVALYVWLRPGRTSDPPVGTRTPARSEVIS